ncbi:hypothetical protein MXB_2262 [Myxobolus squamalis]|nr:hypothetical protein MXB_2262 [Myxobolus squamalis]
MYNLCVLALMTSKSQDTYCIIIHAIFVRLKYSLKPKYIVGDFKKSLKTAVKYIFKHQNGPDVTLIFLKLYNQESIKK